MRHTITQSKRWVIKIGSSLLTDEGKSLNQNTMLRWIEQMIKLRQAGVELIIVSSGAVAAGMAKLGWQNRPKEMNQLQAAAAVGQMSLIQAWENCFDQYQTQAAQILLTHDDLSDRRRYLNARSTLKTLISLGIVPVINENDTVVTDEIRFGDNDTLAALVANLVEADLLVILTDQDGLFSADPRYHAEATVIFEAHANDPSLDAIAGGAGSGVGTGGMQTKLRAARFAARSGTNTLIVGGQISHVLTRLHQAERLGTLLMPDHTPLAARKQWLAGQLQVRGKITVDAGAAEALRQHHTSLLAVGVVSIEGDFYRGEMVTCLTTTGQEIAHGLINYASHEAHKIIGASSEQFEGILGYTNEPELIHRDNLVLV